MEQFLTSSALTDVAILGVLIALFILYAAWQSTGILLSIAIALPIAGFLYSLFPYVPEVQGFLPVPDTWANIFVFAIFLIASLWVLQRTIGFASGNGRPLHIVTTALALSALLIAFSYHIVPIDQLYNFGATFDAVFDSPSHFFWIVTLALLALFVV